MFHVWFVVISSVVVLFIGISTQTYTHTLTHSQPIQWHTHMKLEPLTRLPCLHTSHHSTSTHICLCINIFTSFTKLSADKYEHWTSISIRWVRANINSFRKLKQLCNFSVRPFSYMTKLYNVHTTRDELEPLLLLSMLLLLLLLCCWRCYCSTDSLTFCFDRKMTRFTSNTALLRVDFMVECEYARRVYVCDA